MTNQQPKTFQSVKELFEYALETKMDFDDYMAQMNQLMGNAVKPLGVEYDANWSD
jgi:hypothetical protein